MSGPLSSVGAPRGQWASKLCGVVLTVASGFGLTSPAYAQDAAFLFAYEVHPGMDSAFTAGYRRHLQWHADHADTLAWLAWRVVAGVHPGLFVDGTFGIPTAAFDRRVDPQGDAADAQRNITAFASLAHTYVLRLRGDLGWTAALEERRAAVIQEVVWLEVNPGAEDVVEEAFRRVRPSRDASPLEYAVYELVAGGSHPSYVLVVQLPGWAGLAHGSTRVTRAVLRAAGTALRQVSSEVWSYLPDLSYIPHQ